MTTKVIIKIITLMGFFRGECFVICEFKILQLKKPFPFSILNTRGRKLSLYDKSINQKREKKEKVRSYELSSFLSLHEENTKCIY